MFGDDHGTPLDGSIEERGQLFARLFGTCCVDLSVLASHADTVQTVRNDVNVGCPVQSARRAVESRLP